MTSKNNEANDIVKEMDKSNPVSLFVISNIAGPLIEELVYRKAIYGSIKKNSKSIVYGVSSILFAFEHFGFNFNTLLEKLQSNVMDFPMYFFVDCIRIYNYESTGYLLSSIIAHSLNNYIIAVLRYFDLI
ncbi:hypothetical protein H8356DRAFT_1618968 [Neocallimastix lanati (nom. inval.)]|nr:hypothetical protein H8356DRAFT_1618968 [Neocallimastix sp. JGI-2020a]